MTLRQSDRGVLIGTGPRVPHLKCSSSSGRKSSLITKTPSESGTVFTMENELNDKVDKMQKGLTTMQRETFVKLLAKFISHRETDKKNSEDILFDMFRSEDAETLPIGKFLAALRTFGLRMTDPRLKEMMHNLRMIHRMSKSEGSPETQNLSRENFK